LAQAFESNTWSTSVAMDVCSLIEAAFLDVPFRTLVIGIAAPLILVWFLLPVVWWYRQAYGDVLENQVARTSFQYLPGELAPPLWRPGEVTLSVIVPTFNEADRLPYMLEEAIGYLEDRTWAAPVGGFTYEIVVVDSGSSDDTYTVALRTAVQDRQRTTLRRLGEVRVLELTANRGKGYAARVGMLVARGDLLLLADADGATRIADVERLEQALHKHRWDGVHIAFGSRYHLRWEQTSKRWALEHIRHIFASVSDAMAWLFVGGPVYDVHCGFKLFRARVGKALFASIHLFGWSFDIELLLLARLLGARIAEVPVTYTDMPGSKFKTVRDSMGLLRDTLLVIPLYFCGLWRPSVLI